MELASGQDMEFGVFDHPDRYDLPLDEYCAARLALIEASGFCAYRVAEHAPEAVAAFLRRQLEATRSNHLVGQFAFGDVSLAEAFQPVALFSAEIMPAPRQR